MPPSRVPTVIERFCTAKVRAEASARVSGVVCAASSGITGTVSQAVATPIRTARIAIASRSETSACTPEAALKRSSARISVRDAPNRRTSRPATSAARPAPSVLSPAASPITSSR